MTEENQAMCPLFPNIPCPQGDQAANQCQVRLDADYDPIRDHKDYLFMHCAIHRAEEDNARSNKQNGNS